MHTAMYEDHSDVGCVLHTHSPYATAYAVAHRPIGCWVEALAMFGLPTGVPVAGYGPRGSDQAVANIRATITPGVPAVLLANRLGCSCSTAPQSWPSRSAGSSRKPLRQGSTPGLSAAHRESPRNSGPPLSTPRCFLKEKARRTPDLSRVSFEVWLEQPAVACSSDHLPSGGLRAGHRQLCATDRSHLASPPAGPGLCRPWRRGHSRQWT